MNFDYSPLSQPVTKQDILAYKNAHPKPSHKVVIIATIIIYAAIVVIFGLIIAAHYAQWGTLQPGAVIPIVFPLPILLGMWAYSYFRTKKLAKLYKFAHANELKLISDKADPGYSGMIFDEGHSRIIQEAYLFPDGGEVGNCKYITGSGKHQQTHTWSYMRVKLSRNLPHMVLDAKHNNLFGKFSNLPDSFDKNQTLSLEGDFNDHFTLYAPKQYERDALYVFTPDVMAAAIDSGKDFEMEVIDNNLMLYSKHSMKLDSAEEIQRLLAVMSHIGEELRDQSSYYADERVGDRTANIVAEPGKRLKSGLGVGTIITAIFIIIYIALQIFGD